MPVIYGNKIWGASWKEKEVIAIKICLCKTFLFHMSSITHTKSNQLKEICPEVALGGQP